MKRRAFLRAGAAGVAAATLPRFSIAQPANARVLRFVPQANLTVLDPIFTTAAVTANHAWMVYDTLFGVNAAQQAKPQMAEGYTVSDDGRTYLIKLRDGLKWHDGEPVRAQDCAPSLARWSARDTFGQTVAKVGGCVGRGGRQDDQDHAEEAVPAADRRDCRADGNSLHDAGAAGEDRSVQGDHRGRRLRSVPLPQGRVRRRQQRRVGEVRRLRAAPGAAGMVLAAARSPISSASSGRSSPMPPPRRPRCRTARWTGTSRCRPTSCRC